MESQLYCTLILTKKYFLQLNRIAMEYLGGYYSVTLVSLVKMEVYVFKLSCCEGQSSLSNSITF